VQGIAFPVESAARLLDLAYGGSLLLSVFLIFAVAVAVTLLMRVLLMQRCWGCCGVIDGVAVGLKPTEARGAKRQLLLALLPALLLEAFGCCCSS
jgi:hypothetical protein